LEIITVYSPQENRCHFSLPLEYNPRNLKLIGISWGGNFGFLGI